MKAKFLLLVFALVICGCKSEQNAKIEPRKANLIKPIIKEVIDTRIENKINSSIVIGVIDSTGVDFYSNGYTATVDGKKPDQYTLYEIGSITKVFTGLLLADAVVSGSVSLNDSIVRFMDGELELSDKIASINLKQLATHTAGFGRQSHNLRSEEYIASNPYAHYDEELLLAELKNHKLKFEPGSKSQYSNLGMSLLGYLISQNENQNYFSSLSQNILKPLGMKNTYASMQGENIALGYTFNVPVENWDFGVLGGAGVLKSNINDMLLFLSVQLQLTETKLTDAVTMSQQKHFAVDEKKAIGLGWGVYELENGDKLFRHNGGTAGYRSFIGFLSNAKKGVIVLTNSSNSGVDDIGLHQLVDSLKIKTEFRRSTAQLVSSQLEENKSITVAEIQSVIGAADLDSDWGKLNFLGYTYLKKKDYERAIKVFELNNRIHPNSADGHDSLAEAYYTSGQMKKSLTSYEKALELDSNYENAKRMIEKIKTELESIGNDALKP